MIETGFDRKIKIQDVLNNQLPEFILDESPTTSDFLKQYYISQEYQGGPIDISDNLDQYLNIDNLTPDVIVDNVNLSIGIGTTDTTIQVSNLDDGIDKGTKGFPNKYGLLKIDNEIITYTGITTNTFTGCERGFSGITSYHQKLNNEELIFSTSSAEDHNKNSNIQNLSSLFLKEFYKKFKYTFTPGLESTSFYPSLNVGNFIKESKSFYEAKGTDESFRILFNALYGITPQVVNLEEFLIKPSSSDYVRRQICIAELISGNPLKLQGQSIFRSNFNEDINASVSEVETFTRDNKQYYRISLFLGFDENSDVEGDFIIIPNTKSLENVSIGSSVISVDSTIGFSTSGTVVSGINTITYTDKTINQFLNCSWADEATSEISATDNVRSDDIYFGYEDGDITKKVELRFTGVLSKFVQKGSVNVSEGDIISVKNIGDKIKNPIKKPDRTNKEIFANSWIYNTRSSYEIKSLLTEDIELKSPIDRSSLKYGDRVEIIERDSGKVVYPLGDDDIPYIGSEIENGDTAIELRNFSYESNPLLDYNIRKKINTANSVNIDIKYGNDKVISDILNVYTDSHYAYVASNSLPSYNPVIGEENFPFTEQIETDLIKNTINISNNVGFLTDAVNDEYSSLSFNENVSFKTGDKIFYKPSASPLVGLETGIYYVEVLSDPKKIKLFGSRSGISGNQYQTFVRNLSDDGSHEFILYSQKSEILAPQKLFKKFPLVSNIKNGIGETTIPGGIGMLINGVEISNYKSEDKVYYGPIESVNILNGGENFDVINIPSITVNAGLGNTALIQPILSGNVTEILVDEQDFDIDRVVSIGITGGNGTDCVLEPVLTKRFRQVDFKGSVTSSGGGINTTTNQILFVSDHGFSTGEEIIYDSGANKGIGVGIGTSTLIRSGRYYSRVSNNRAIKLFETYSDSIAGINTIIFNGDNTFGLHNFKVGPRNKLSQVKITNSGKNYTNRKLIVKPIGISTEYDSVTFNNHGFESGEKIVYSTDGTPISGLSTDIQYKVIKLDNNSFKLADAGIGGTISSNYDIKKYVKFNSSGVGYQNFAYPKIEGFIEFTTIGIGLTSLNITPIVKGSIVGTYVYESGTGYGSTILNFEKKPILTVKTGKKAELKPIIINGRINSVNVQFGGTEYYSIPDLEIIDSTGSGSGAKLRTVLDDNQKIREVKVINPGIGYSTDSSILVKSSGQNESLDVKIRELTIDNHYRFGKEFISESSNNLKYSVCGYNSNIFNDSIDFVSPIIGWAYDGNPIYGPYANSNSDGSGDLRLLTSGYTLDGSKVIDRPSFDIFDEGYFVEDYYYNNSGDLDENNGRFEITEDYPNGVYAYHALIDNIGISSFPYFIGNTYRSNVILENITQFDQSSFDFKNSNIRRNTFPYKVSDNNANNDFLIETNEIVNQKVEIESISVGSITGFDVVSAGSSFKVNDTLNFNNEGTSGSGLIAKVSSIGGKKIETLNTTIETYEDAVISWQKDKVKVSITPYHNLNNSDNVIISGLSTTLSNLNGSYKIGITSYISRSISTMFAASDVGVTTEIYVTAIPESISIGSSITISNKNGTESLRILDIYKDISVLRVERGISGLAHPEGSLVQYTPDSFTISKEIPYFESEANNKVYFNASQSVGVGTTPGSDYPVEFKFANRNIKRSIPIQTIYLENHPFKTNQKINFTIPVGYSNIGISTLPDSTVYNITEFSRLYAVNKGPNTIGIKTGIGTTGGSDLYFRSVIGGLGGDHDKYLFESDFDQVTAKIEKIKSQVSVSTSHGLKIDDKINLIVNPNLSVGIGTSISVKVKRDVITGNLLINPIEFTSSGINTNTDTITYNSHGLKTGDKILYSSANPPSGLSTNNYYVYRVDDNEFKLCDTYINAVKNIPSVINLTSTGGSSQIISLINPRIEIVKDNNSVFDLSDSSLTGYNFKLYYDQKFNNEFISVGSTNIFNISNVGTALTIGYANSLPSKLYYSLEKAGYISTADNDVKNYSEILFIDSFYNGTYNISGIGTTTFDIFLKQKPENLSYASSECNVLEYSSDSLSIDGPIDKIEILSSGVGYKKFPKYVGSSSTIGKEASIVSKSDSIGNIQKVRIINEGYEYSSDVTLKPEAFISPIIQINNANTVGIVSVINNGSGYSDSPDLILIDTDSGEIIKSGFLESEMLGRGISNVNVVEKPIGLPNKTVGIKAINNTNGISVSQVISNAGSAFTCILVTPTLGFSTSPFNIGDKVYVEGIQGFSTDGSGFNSEDYKYDFFTVSGPPNILSNANPFRVEFDLSGITTNTGIAKTIQESYGSLIREDYYPSFDIVQERSSFVIGEQLLSDDIERDLIISEDDQNNSTIKVFGTYELSIGEVIVGKTSGTQARVNQFIENAGVYEIDFSLKKDIGWDNDIGKLDLDNQVIPDNDYYQNLSYSIKSPIQWKDLQTPVNNLLHTSGTKNFSDTGISSSVGVGIGSSSAVSITQDIIEESRVDIFTDLDLALDKDVVGRTSKFIEFKNIRLTNYVDCLTNEVLAVDNINQEFSNLEGDPSYFLNLTELNTTDLFDTYLVRLVSFDYSDYHIQLSELSVFSNNTENILFDKSELINSGIGFTSYSDDRHGTFVIEKDEDTNRTYLRFSPTNPYDIDYDLKIIKSAYNSTLPGFGSFSIGPIDLNSYIGDIDSGVTTSIISVDSTKFDSLHVSTQVMNNETKEINYVESYITHDHSNSYIAEYYVDGSKSEINRMGVFTPSLSENILSFNYDNTETSNVTVRSKIVGLGTTGISNAEYRYQIPGQLDGFERSAIYQGISTVGVGTTTFVGLSSDLFDCVKSIVEVSIGSSKALHQVMAIHDNNGVYVQPSQFLEIGNDDNPTGLGTFTGSYDGSQFVIQFHPNDLVGILTVKAYNQCIYKQLDQENDYPSFSYGKLSENIEYAFYNAVNGKRINKSSFKLKNNSTPIFSKKFNPSDSNAFIATTGQFNIKDHFFKTNEELIYTPKSTIVGVGSTAMMYKNGSVIAELPSNVFAIRTNDNQFQISTEKSGVAVTFTGIGTGNAHQFTMAKRNEKAIIQLDGILQYPPIRTDVTHTLSNNIGGQIGTATTIFSLSGISSIQISDLLLIGDEYLGVTNVGIATTTIGPVTPGIGTYTIVVTERGFVGTSATSYPDSTEVQLYKGSYNIVDDSIYFTRSPRGNPQVATKLTGLPFPRSSFNGRVFLRQDYSTNVIYDDISNQFTGLKSDFTLKVGGANTIGIGTSGGNGILFLNGIFQTPTTDNNPANNFKIVESGSGATGVSSVIFSGITSTDGNLVRTDFDVNQNQMPRGGIIISLGSTPGSGYAPLLGAKIRPTLDVNGSLTNIVGVATTGSALGINTASYDNKSGILTITTIEPHYFTFGDIGEDEVKLSRLEFACSGSYGITTTFFPETNNDYYSIISVASTNTFSVNVGTSTIPHNYVGNGNVMPWYGDLTFGSGYNDIVSIAVTVKDPGYEHKFIKTTNNPITIEANSIGSNSNITASNVIYAPDTGKLILYKDNHESITYTTHKAVTGTEYNGQVGILTVKLDSAPTPALANGQIVKIDDYGLTFRCALDGHTTDHKYPRVDDPISGTWVPISNVTGGDQFEINVLNTIPSTNVSDHTFHGGTDSGIKRSANTIRLDDNSLTFTCSKDDHATEHSYPRTTDPVSGISTSIVEATTNSITINVGTNVGSGADITAYPVGFNTHRFVSAYPNSITVTSGSEIGQTKQPIEGTTYNPQTGILRMKVSGHNMSDGDEINFTQNSIVFTCAQDSYSTQHTYPRSTDPIVGVGNTEISNASTDYFEVNVGKSTFGSGGALEFNIVSAGTSYKRPEIFVSEPSYENLSVSGISRLDGTTDVGTGLLLDVNIGASSTTGIGSGLFEVSDFKISRNGYGFRRGDVFEPIGLVTDRKLYELNSKFKLEVTQEFDDTFALWQFGELDYIDSIKYYQDGVRTRFPLFYNGELISIEPNKDYDTEISSVLVVMRNGVLQEPLDAYYFVSGTSLNFTVAPRKEDNISIFFYKGTDGVDCNIITPPAPDLQIGDEIQMMRNAGIKTTITQDRRTVYEFPESDELGTNVYYGEGVNTKDYKSVNFIKQKHDIVINSDVIPKTRIKLEPLIFPTSKIIAGFSTLDTTFFVDDASIFEYEDGNTTFGGLIVSNFEKISAAATATIDDSGSVSGITYSPGSGYSQNPNISLSSPPNIHIGGGITATASISISNGSVNSLTVTNTGSGYTVAPQVLITPVTSDYEVMGGSSIVVQSTSGIVTGITTTTTSTSTLALRIVAISTIGFNPISIGNPLYLYDTRVGSGATSMDPSGINTVSIGTTFLDNVYVVTDMSTQGVAPNPITGIFTCNLESNNVVVGVASTGSIENPVGKFSCGKISNFIRSSSPISIGVTYLSVDSGLSTFPTLQRRGGSETFRDTGAIGLTTGTS